MTVKNLLSFFALFIFVSLLFPAKYSNAKSLDEARAKENIANILNYAQVSIYTITAFNHRLVLDQEYQTILNNLKLREIPDVRAIELFTALMDSLTGAVLNDRQRKQWDRLHSQSVKRAARNVKKQMVQQALDIAPAMAAGALQGATTGGPIGGALGVGRAGVGTIANMATAYWDYQAQIEEMQDNKSNQNWELDNDVIGKLNEIRKKMLRLSWELYTEYKIDEDLRLVENDISELIDINKERNIQKRFRMLNETYMRKKFARFAPYWYYLGSSAQLALKTSGEEDHRKLALQAYNMYEKTRSAVLKKDEMYTTVALGRAVLLDKSQNREEIIRNLEIIEANPPKNWMTILGMALQYAQLERYEKAQRWVQHNLDRETGDKALHQQVMGGIMAQKGDFKSLTTLVQRMVSDNIIRTFEILDMVGSLKPVQIVNQLRPRLLTIKPIINTRRFQDDDITLKSPLWLEKDTRKLTLISGAAIFDPNTNLRNLKSDQERSPDTVTHSEDGEVANYGFEKIFNEEDWVRENRSHILFRLHHEEQIIDLMFALMKDGKRLKDNKNSDAEIEFKLIQIALGSDQFIEQDGGRFIEAGPPLRAEFDASLEGITFKLGTRYKVKDDTYGGRLRSILRATEIAGDREVLADLVLAMKEDPSTGTLDIIDFATALEKPEKIMVELPVNEANLMIQEQLLGKAVTASKKALSILGSIKIGEVSQDLILLLPDKWITESTKVTAEISPEVCKISPSKPEKTEDQQSWSFFFVGCFNAERWQKDKLNQVSVSLLQKRSILKFNFSLNGKSKDADPAFTLKDVKILRP